MNRPGGWRERMARMNQRSLFGPGIRGVAAASASESESEERPVSGQARAEAVQRLQVGLLGIGSMVLLVGLASVIGGQAERNDQLAVPEAAPTTEPSAAPPVANPLADAGVVPDIEADPSPAAPAPPAATPARPAAPVDAAPAP